MAPRRTRPSGYRITPRRGGSRRGSRVQFVFSVFSSLHELKTRPSSLHGAASRRPPPRSKSGRTWCRAKRSSKKTCSTPWRTPRRVAAFAHVVVNVAQTLAQSQKTFAGQHTRVALEQLLIQYTTSYFTLFSSGISSQKMIGRSMEPWNRGTREPRNQNRKSCLCFIFLAC